MRTVVKTSARGRLYLDWAPPARVPDEAMTESLTWTELDRRLGPDRARLELLRGSIREALDRKLALECQLEALLSALRAQSGNLPASRFELAQCAELFLQLSRS